MRTWTLRLTFLPVCLLGTILGGCDRAADTTGAATKESPPPAVVTDIPSATNSEAASARQPKTPALKTEPAKEKPRLAMNDGYIPPFPDRIDMFLAPRRAGTPTGKSAASTVPDVELLGFANVSEPLAILSINGLVLPLAEGASGEGVEVISIQPPSVVLQRDRQRWQASLEN